MSGDCERCPVDAPRREFLRDVGASLAAIAVLIGMPDPVGAIAVTRARGLGSRDDKQYALPVEDGAMIDKEESVIIARAAGRVYAFSLACPHQNTAIRWEAGAHRFQCPKHHSKYQPDGSFIEGRATRGLDRFAVRRDGDHVAVNLDALYRQDQDAAAWAAAFIQL